MVTDMKTLIDGALWWAERGVPVFPVNSRKRPVVKTGFQAASTDPDTIREMFSRSGTAGIGAAMGERSGLFAIDSDHYKEGEAGEAAKAYIAGLLESGLLPETRQHKTVSGGVHYILKSDNAWPNVKPSKGVEVKGEGGYIVVPPTPGYEVVGGEAPQSAAEAPQELVQALLATRVAASAAPSQRLAQAILEASDFHDSLAMLAARYAAQGKPAAEVQKELMALLEGSVASSKHHPRHNRWLSLVKDDGKELSRIVGSSDAKFNNSSASDDLREAAAGRFGSPDQNPMHPAVQSDAAEKLFGKVAEKPQVTDEWPFAGERGYFTHEDLNVLEQDYVMFPVLAEGETTMISAEPKAGKTLVAQTIAMHVAAGMDLGSLKVHERRPVLYFALESQIAIRRRLVAWKKTHDPEGVIFNEANFQMYVAEMPVNLLEEKVRKKLSADIASANNWFVKEGAAPLGAIVIDTLTKAMPGGDQNSVEDTSAVFEIINEIRSLGITAPIVFIHHNRKDGGSPRGSGNIQAEPDTLLTLEKNPDTQQLHLRVYMARSIDDDQSFIFDLASVTLGKTKQGFEIAAPVLYPAAVEKTAADGVSNTLREEMGYKDMMLELVKFGPGTHSIKEVHVALKRKLGDTRLYGPVKNVWATSAEYMEFFTSIIPDTGRNFQDFNITPVVRNHPKRGPRLEGVRIKKVEAA